MLLFDLLWNHHFYQEWSSFFGKEITKPYFRKLDHAVTTSFQADQICPTPEDIFRIFTLVKPAKIKVIIIGQDPYYRHGYADGIAFSAHRSYHLPPPSLRNIFAELFSNYQVDHLNNWSLAGWVSQGVFLINTMWTVIHKKPLSHQHYGWEVFTQNLISFLCNLHPDLIFVLWGRHAQAVATAFRGYVKIISGHPSPLSVRFFKETKPFLRINTSLVKMNKTPINWSK